MYNVNGGEESGEGVELFTGRVKRGKGSWFHARLSEIKTILEGAFSGVNSSD